MKKEEFNFNGYEATVLIPDKPNGKWIWKTEFFYDFDKAERALFDKGYTRVYYRISNKYGSKDAVRLMYEFHNELLKRYSFLCMKAILFGFSRGGLYAFNYALNYSERVGKIYFDAPVLNLKSWPHAETNEQRMFFEEYGLSAESFRSFRDSPIDHLTEFAENGIPVLLIAGDKDLSVPFNENGKIMLEYYRAKNKKIRFYLKKGAGHHPHSLEDVKPILEFIENE